jgi:hypothetical protein
MSYHAPNNLRAPIGRQKALLATQNAPKTFFGRYTEQEIYNGYAYVMGNVMAWGFLGLVTYHAGKPWVQILLASSLF